MVLRYTIYHTKKQQEQYKNNSNNNYTSNYSKRSFDAAAYPAYIGSIISALSTT